MQFRRLRLIVCFLIVFLFLLPAKGIAQPVRKSVEIANDFWHDSFLDKPFQYSPDDPWKRGRIFNMQTGNFGRYYNCDGEECKRYSPYICWKVHDEPDFLPIFNFRTNLRNDICSVRQRIIDGTSGCLCSCGKPGCSKCSRRPSSTQCRTCGKNGCPSSEQGFVNSLPLEYSAEASNGTSTSHAANDEFSTLGSVKQSGYLIASFENEGIVEYVQQLQYDPTVLHSTDSIVEGTADLQCCNDRSDNRTNCGCERCRRSKCDGRDCAPDPNCLSFRKRKCVGLNCHDIDTSFDENSPAGLLSGYPVAGIEMPIDAQPCNCVQCQLKMAREKLATWNDQTQNQFDYANSAAKEPSGLQHSRPGTKKLRR